MVIVNPHHVVVLNILRYCFGKKSIGLVVGAPRLVVESNFAIVVM
jgi:hypothetical protein